MFVSFFFPHNFSAWNVLRGPLENKEFWALFENSFLYFFWITDYWAIHGMQLIIFGYFFPNNYDGNK